MYIVEFTTTAGKVCESFATFEEAEHRVAAYPAEGLVDVPLIFKELPDGSQRLVREDEKPLQWHRLPEDRPSGPDAPLPLCEEVDPTWKVERMEPLPSPDDDAPLPFD